MPLRAPPELAGLRGGPPAPKTWGLEHGGHVGGCGHRARWVPGQQTGGKGT